MKGKRIPRFWKKKDKSSSDPMNENMHEKEQEHQPHTSSEEKSAQEQPTPEQQASSEEQAKTPEEETPQAEVQLEAEEAQTEIEVEVEGVQTKAEAAKSAGEKDAQELGTMEEAMEVIAKLQVELRQAREEAQQAQAHAVRLQADFQNYRRRQEKELTNTVRFANEDLIKQLLPILDNFDRTLDAMEKTDNLSAIKEGIAMVDKSMKKQLNKMGVEPIHARGKEFDSELHEAITTVSVEDEAQKGKVLDVVERGYKLKDRVLRYAKVVIGE
jgi:molecular chaperone GrpE